MKKIVSEQLFLFLSVLMFGKRPESPQFDNDMQRKVLSVAQDILFSAPSSCCKTPKHIGLAVSMKHITGSKMVLKLLHSLGHSISYEDISSLDSATASNLMADLAEDGENYLPTNVSPGLFSHAAMDNIDINEETRSGKGTTHVLGSVIYQEQQTFDLAVGYRHQSRRQIPPLQNLSGIDMIHCPNKNKVHTAPAHLLGRVNVNSWLTSTDENLTLDRLYIVACLCPTKIFEVDIKPLTPKDQNIPSRKGFYAILQYKFDQHPPKTSIGYNPIIRGIPTEKNTIYTGLKLIERQMGTVGEFPPITTLDLQLYIIAQEIRFANWDELGHHILRLGGFHVHEQVWKIFGK